MAIRKKKQDGDDEKMPENAIRIRNKSDAVKAIKAMKEIVGMMGEDGVTIDDEQEDDEVLVKSLPAKSEWIQQHEAMIKKADQLKHETRILLNDREIFWNTIKKELDSYDTHLRFNDETNEVEIYEERDND